MGGQPQTFAGGIFVLLAKQLGRGFLLVAADADTDYISILILRREFKDVLRCTGAEVADSVEDP